MRTSTVSKRPLSFEPLLDRFDRVRRQRSPDRDARQLQDVGVGQGRVAVHADLARRSPRRRRVVPARVERTGPDRSADPVVPNLVVARTCRSRTRAVTNPSFGIRIFVT